LREENYLCPKSITHVSP